MNFDRHLELRGKHAFFSASNYHWIRYDLDKMREVYQNHLATLRGTQLHDLAARCIGLGINLPSSRKTLNQYVNDAIGYRMIAEQPLFYGPNFFGTTDAISFRKKLLRIHDLKTGMTPASMDQLKVYAAFFCLERGLKPEALDMEFRIYQNNDISVLNPDRSEIGEIMNKAVVFNNEVIRMREGAGIDVEEEEMVGID